MSYLAIPCFIYLMFLNVQAEISFDIKLSPVSKNLLANGLDQRVISIKSLDSKGNIIKSTQRYTVQLTGDSVKLSGYSSGVINKGVNIILRAGLKPGKSDVILKIGSKLIRKFTLNVETDYSDTDLDGLPDSVELEDEQDRKAFIAWFLQIVELQYYHESRKWAGSNKDCSGLARFAYMEALKSHNDRWKKRWQHLFDWSQPNVRKYQYPDVPLIGRKIFRIHQGPFTRHDLANKKFSIFASSEKLMRYNTRYIAVSLSKAAPGDLLFFKRGRSHHLMIMLGPSHSRTYLNRTATGHQADPENMRDSFIVYHTGPINKSGGEVRKVSLRALMNHPDPKWRPIAENPGFLGVFRWNIID